VVVKVPSRRFREAMSEVDRTFEVERRNVKAEDVTAEFKDLEVRLENLRATRKRLEQLLEKTGTLADTLSVEKELERVAGEIDRIQGRIRFLRNHTSFSRLTVAVTEKPKPNVAVATTTPGARRDLSLPMPWIERVGVPALLEVSAED
jgi:chromosome segregation ATPase